MDGIRRQSPSRCRSPAINPEARFSLPVSPRIIAARTPASTGVGGAAFVPFVPAINPAVFGFVPLLAPCRHWHRTDRQAADERPDSSRPA